MMRIVCRAVAISLLLIPSFCLATVLHVPGDYADIGEAVNAASNGDSVLVAPGSYTDLSFILEGKDVSLIGTAGAEETFIDYQIPDGPRDRDEYPASMVFMNGVGPDALVQGFTFKNKRVQGFWSLILCWYASPTFRDLVFENNDMTDFGGSDSGYGGVLRCNSASPQVYDCCFKNNAAWKGGAVYLENDSSPRFEDVEFIANAANDGGAVYSSGGHPTFLRASFVDNLAIDYLHESYGWEAGNGGAVADFSSIAHFEDCLFARNIAEFAPEWAGFGESGRGGAVFSSSSNSYFLGCTFYGNLAQDFEGYDQNFGGALYFSDSGDNEVNISCCIVADSFEGGGIYAASAAAVPDIGCSDVWGNDDGNYTGACPDFTGQWGNISEDPQFCAPCLGDFKLSERSPCLPWNNDCGELMGVFGEGCTSTVVDEMPPAQLRLGRSFPNPFNPSTEIEFVLAEPATLGVEICDLAGRRVRILLSATAFEAGEHRIRWDGRGERGQCLSSGVYMLRVQISNRVFSRKLILLK